MVGLIKHKVRRHPSDCVNCGVCKARCPIYKETSKESYGARGRMALIKAFSDGELIDTKQLSERLFSCLLCGACNKSCPLNIDLTRSICEIRGLLKHKDKKTHLLSYLIKYGFRNPKNIFKGIGFFDYLCQHLPFKEKLDNLRRRYGLKITPSKTSLVDTITLSKAKESIGRVAVYPGCSVNYLFASMGISLIEVLNQLNYDIVIPRKYFCCGAPQFAMGFLKEAENIARKQIEVFQSFSLDAVVSLCPTCVHMMSDVYEILIGETIQGIIDANRFIAKHTKNILDISDNISSLYTDNMVIYHQPCHSKNYINAGNEIPSLLKSVGLHLHYDDTCCGFGGTFRFIQTGLSNMLTSRIKQRYSQSGLVITSCPNCIIQFRNHNINSKHFIDIIKYAMKG
ncbi:MAG: (Fe-S)-binding protein [Thermodesulfovibrionales bacterium]|nr:(Fe-S)-binding protein [Thermodesulfovibrionales bacterium]